MKSPNTDSKAKKCWYCDNYYPGRKCECKQTSRAANKRRWRNEVKKEQIELRYCSRYYPFIGPQL